MTAEEIKQALADRGMTDAEVRLDYAGESFRVSVARNLNQGDYNARRVSHSKRVDNNPTTGELDALAHAFKQWWNEVTE
jgi:hypothetical protein